MTDYTRCNRLKVAAPLLQFVDQQVLPDTGMDREAFWEGFDELLHELAPLHRDLLCERERLQQALTDGQQANPPASREPTAWRQWLESSGGLLPLPEHVRASTASLDLEISDLAGPQLLAAGNDAQAVLEAVNARWGSLYAALYGTDAIAMTPGCELDRQHNPQRAAKVVVQVRELLDRFTPLASGTHVDARHYRIRHGQLSVTLADGQETGLQHPEHYRGHLGEPLQPQAILLRHHGLHIEIRIDAQSLAGGCDVAGICDVQLEAALSSIIDVSDPLPTVDAASKLTAFGNWLALMKNDPGLTRPKNGKAVAGHPAPDRHYQAAGGGELKLPGRALLLLRINGPAIHSPAVLDAHGNGAAQIILDAVLGSLIALHDLAHHGNSRTGSVYLTIPDLQGPAEVAFAGQLFSRIETLLGLAPYTLKLGLIDDHWRTALNLEACIQAAAARIALLRTGPLADTRPDEYTAWQRACRQRDIRVGLACGLRGRALIGTGLWNRADQMADMLACKIDSLRDGASTGLVSTPTAATLHALHYHQVDVRAVQAGLEQSPLLQDCAQLHAQLLDTLVP